MKHYIVRDLQGGGFMSWTHQEPQTKQQIRSYLYQMANNDKMCEEDMWQWNDFKLDEALSDWGIELEEVY